MRKDEGKGLVLGALILAATLWYTGRRRAELQTATPAGAPPLEGEYATLMQRIAGGQTDVNALTDLVFFGRHPERQYARIRKDEPLLAQEWLTIRDSMVRPALEQYGAFGTGGASGTF